MNPEVIDIYKRDLDISLIKENLKLTPHQRCEKFEQFMEMIFELRSKAADNRRKSREIASNSSQKES